VDLDQKHCFFPCKFSDLKFVDWDTKEIADLRFSDWHTSEICRVAYQQKNVHAHLSRQRAKQSGTKPNTENITFSSLVLCFLKAKLTSKTHFWVNEVDR